ncbi:MAG: hypothetical protein KIT34_10415 [Cyanobacteria bacterium TGS_CYA1]|nr:hypothetical protein [Cyanobacteria bacterium TGS_CYA1]
MKNRECYLMLVLAGIACTALLAGCTKKIDQDKQSNDRIEEKSFALKPRLSKTVINKMPSKFECLIGLLEFDGHCILAANSVEECPEEDELSFYKMDLKDLTVKPFQICATNQKVCFWNQFDKAILFVTRSKGQFFIVVMGAGPTLNIPLPCHDNNFYTVPQPFLDRDRLFVLFGDRLLQWNINKGRAQSLPESKLVRLSYPGWEKSDRSSATPIIESISGDKLWILDAFNSYYNFDLKSNKTTLVSENQGKHGDSLVCDKHKRQWTWYWTGKSELKDSRGVPRKLIFNLTCRDKGRLITEYKVLDIVNVFFDKADNPLILTKDSTILKLMNGKWAVFQDLDFLPLDESKSASILEDGRIAIISRPTRDPRMGKRFDPSISIINPETNDYEIAYFSYIY